MTYLRLDIDRPEAVEQLQRRQDMAMDQDRCRDGRRCPPSSHRGHFIEPLLERELPSLPSIAPDGGHSVEDPRRRPLMQLSTGRQRGYGVRT